MSCCAEGKPIQCSNDEQRAKIVGPSQEIMSIQRGSYETDRAVVCEESETKRRKRSTLRTRADIGKRQIEIRDYVFSFSLSGVEITHCNFGKTQVEVWYVTEKTDSDRLKEEMEKEIGSRVEPYKLKLVKMAGLPKFKYTSPGQSTSLMRRDGSIGAYVTIADGNGGQSKLHALVSGHGKESGDVLYSDLNPGQRVGEVKVAKEGNKELPSGESYDVGLVCMDEQRVDQHETSVTMNGKRIQLDTVTAALRAGDVTEGQQVMLFSNRNKQGTVLYNGYNSGTQQKFGMIGITKQLGEEMQAIHGVNESGTLVVALSPISENGERRMKAVGMLVGIEEFQQSSPGSISLAVPIGTNLQELIRDDYCANKGPIEFA